MFWYSLFDISSMSSIPKWFIYNACRGPLTKKHSSSPTVTTVNAQVTGDETPFSGDPRHYPTSFTFPEDILISWASEDNYVCFRDPDNGSWFINELVKVLEEHHELNHLQEMLDIVTKRVEKRVDQEGNSQQPTYQCRLSHHIHFKKPH